MTVSTENPLVNAVGGTKLNAQAAEFVPGSSRAAPKGVTDSENLKSEILNVRGCCSLEVMHLSI